MERIRRLSCFALALLAYSGALHSQQDQAPAAPAIVEPQAGSDAVMTLHAGTHLVVLDVVVTDKKGHTIPGLSQDLFRISEDGQPQAVKFLEEHAPVDPALVVKERAELAARLPVNTFTNYEPFTGNPVNVLLLNKLTPLPAYDIDALRQQVLGVIFAAPKETPFAIYQLDSTLRLVQPATDNRDLLTGAVNQMWVQPDFGVPPAALGMSPPGKSQLYSNAAVVLARRKVFSAAFQQISSSFGPAMGRKTLFMFTGGLRCSMSSAPDCSSGSEELKPYLCGLIDTLEQARISMYRYYPDGQAVYGFGCVDQPAALRDVFDTNSHYYTLYYSPGNMDWNGKYRKFHVDLGRKDLRTSYRRGYFATPENIAAGHYAAPEGPVAPAGADATVTASAAGSAGASAAGSPAVTGSSTAAPDPRPVVFTVQVIPAAAPGSGAQAAPPVPGSVESEAERKQGYRDYTLRFFVAARELRVTRVLGAGANSYTARMEVGAISYEHGHAADQASSQFSATFEGPDDPRIAKAEITANLKLQIPEKGKRLLLVRVRDVYSGQSGTLEIPVEKIVLPAK